MQPKYGLERKARSCGASGAPSWGAQKVKPKDRNPMDSGPVAAEPAAPPAGVQQAASPVAQLAEQSFAPASSSVPSR